MQHPQVPNGHAFAEAIEGRNLESYQIGLRQVSPVLHGIAEKMVGKSEAAVALMTETAVILWKEAEISMLIKPSFVLRFWQTLAWRANHLYQVGDEALALVPTGMQIRPEAERVLQATIFFGKSPKEIASQLNISLQSANNRLHQAFGELYSHVHGVPSHSLEWKQLTTAALWLLTPAQRPESPPNPPEILAKMATALELYLWRFASETPHIFQNALEEAVRQIQLPVLDGQEDKRTTTIRGGRSQPASPILLAEKGWVQIPAWWLYTGLVFLGLCAGTALVSYLMMDDSREVAVRQYQFLQKENQILSDNLMAAQNRAQSNEKLVELLRTERPDISHLRGSAAAPENDILVMVGQRSQRLYLYPYYISSPAEGKCLVLWQLNGSNWQRVSALPFLANEPDNYITLGKVGAAKKFLLTEETNKSVRQPSKKVLAQ